MMRSLARFLDARDASLSDVVIPNLSLPQGS